MKLKLSRVVFPTFHPYVNCRFCFESMSAVRYTNHLIGTVTGESLSVCSASSWSLRSFDDCTYKLILLDWRQQEYLGTSMICHPISVSESVLVSRYFECDSRYLFVMSDMCLFDMILLWDLTTDCREMTKQYFLKMIKCLLSYSKVSQSALFSHEIEMFVLRSRNDFDRTNLSLNYQKCSCVFVLI
jgi:hypothetical protein